MPRSSNSNANSTPNTSGGRNSRGIPASGRRVELDTRASSQEVEGTSAPVIQKKRRRSDDDDGDPISPPLTVGMRSLIHGLVSSGKHIARTVDLFGSWPAILRDGLEDQDTDEASIADMTYSLEQLANQKKFKALLDTYKGADAERFIDACFDEARGQQFTRRAASELMHQTGQAKQNDNSTLKKVVIKWLNFPNGLDPDNKTHRGFKHEATARCLLPMSQHPYTTQKRLDVDDGKIVLKAHDWPLFLWKNEDCGNNPTRRRVGLFQNQILLKAFQAIFTSPSSANGSDRSRRPSNASKHDMTEVTPPAIAYVAALLYYALSNDNTFNLVTNAGFNLKEFYLGIIDYFEHSSNEERVRKLLTWWNKKVFPNAQRQVATGSDQRFPEFESGDDMDDCDEEN